VQVQGHLIFSVQHSPEFSGSNAEQMATGETFRCYRRRALENGRINTYEPSASNHIDDHLFARCGKIGHLDQAAINEENVLDHATLFEQPATTRANKFGCSM
jgi:hypothetical protein